MTVAVAVKKNKDIVLAAETQFNYGSATYSSANHKAHKIIKMGNAYVACTGWSLYENIFEDYLSGKKKVSLNSKKDIFKFFIKFWKDLKKNYSYVEDQADDDESPFAHLDASFLIVNKKGIFHVSPNMSITQFEKYYAVGSGADYSLGALFTLYDQKQTAKNIAKQAVEAAIAYDIYCGGEIDIIKV